MIELNFDDCPPYVEIIEPGSNFKNREEALIACEAYRVAWAILSGEAPQTGG